MAAWRLRWCWASLSARAVARPLARAVRIAEGMADGDLTQRIEVQSAGEAGQCWRHCAA
ncbi:HAMP domain-containing protein [Acidovorax sp.]|uniref:HAMP domain-containing protein n=1 Tax=Acidovorax sp. TaxID=1872122 RepID=UPI002ACDDB8F|nr:HAMP domain-containing protein [Acidovorax sp.]MDZ7863247.1 HAMP domain-containing protein [Acidovorax sp.]